MNAIDKALQEIRATIPLPILQRSFINTIEHYQMLNVSLDSVIRDQVISQRVWADCSLQGAQQILIPFRELKPMQPDAYSFIYRIPKSMTNGRSIMSVLDVVYYVAQGLVAYGGSYSMVNSLTTSNENSPILQAGKALRDVDGNIAQISTANAQIIGENVIFINDNSGLVVAGGAHVKLAHDDQFSNIKPELYGAFSKLCVLATKAWIFNNMEIIIDRNEVWSGMVVGKFKEIVDRYSSAEEMYQEYKDTTWRKAQVSADYVTSNRIIRGMFGFAR